MKLCQGSLYIFSLTSFLLDLYCSITCSTSAESHTNPFLLTSVLAPSLMDSQYRCKYFPLFHSCMQMMPGSALLAGMYRILGCASIPSQCLRHTVGRQVPPWFTGETFHACKGALHCLKCMEAGPNLSLYQQGMANSYLLSYEKMDSFLCYP